MKQSIQRLGLLFLLSSGLFLASCKDESSTPTPAPAAAYGSGIFVVNEGPFQNGTGTITFINRSSNAVQQDVFQAANGRPLGNVAQGMASFGTVGILVVNNAGKIEFVDLKDFKSTGVIENMALPSAIAVAGNTGKAYVTEWVGFSGNGRVAVIDIASKQVLRRITVGEFPNAVTWHNNRIFVANSNQNTVVEIDPQADTILRTHTVGDRPNSMRSVGNSLFVLCSGNPSWAGTETAGALAEIVGSQVSIRNFTAATMHPGQLTLHPDGGSLLYQLPEGIYTLLPTASGSITPGTPVIDRSFYHFSVDPQGFFYGTDAKDFQSNGVILRYERNFVLKDSLPAGIAPGSIYYR